MRRRVVGGGGLLRAERARRDGARAAACARGAAAERNREHGQVMGRQRARRRARRSGACNGRRAPFGDRIGGLGAHAHGTSRRELLQRELLLRLRRAARTLPSRVGRAPVPPAIAAACRSFVCSPTPRTALVERLDAAARRPRLALRARRPGRWRESRSRRWSTGRRARGRAARAAHRRPRAPTRAGRSATQTVARAQSCRRRILLVRPGGDGGGGAER